MMDEKKNIFTAGNRWYIIFTVNLFLYQHDSFSFLMYPEVPTLFLLYYGYLLFSSYLFAVSR